MSEYWPKYWVSLLLNHMWGPVVAMCFNVMFLSKILCFFFCATVIFIPFGEILLDRWITEQFELSEINRGQANYPVILSQSLCTEFSLYRSTHSWSEFISFYESLAGRRHKLISTFWYWTIWMLNYITTILIVCPLSIKFLSNWITRGISMYLRMCIDLKAHYKWLVQFKNIKTEAYGTL